MWLEKGYRSETTRFAASTVLFWVVKLRSWQQGVAELHVAVNNQAVNNRWNSMWTNIEWYCACAWNNPDFTCTTVGFKLAFCTRAPEENISSVTAEKDKEKKTKTETRNYWERKGEQNIIIQLYELCSLSILHAVYGLDSVSKVQARMLKEAEQRWWDQYMRSGGRHQKFLVCKREGKMKGLQKVNRRWLFTLFQYQV